MKNTAQIISERLREFLEADQGNRNRLIRSGFKNGIIDQILDGTIDCQTIFTVARKLFDIGIDIREVYFQASRNSFAVAGSLPSAFADIGSFEELKPVFLEEVNSLSAAKLGAYFEVRPDKRFVRQWAIGWPSEKRVVQMLRFVKESREGTISIPAIDKLPKKKADKLVKSKPYTDWRARLRELSLKEPLRYSRDKVADKIGIRKTIIRHWLNPSEMREPRPDHLALLRREFPELFADIPASPSSLADPTTVTASVANQQKALSSLVSMMFSAINVIATVVDPQKVVEGEQARIIEAVGKLFAAVGIDQRTFVRLSNIQPLDPQDPAVRALFGKR